MFMGALPFSARSILGEIIESWKPSVAYVGCSGNFTIERLINANLPNTQIHGNDVTIYSCMFGNYYMGKSLDVQYNLEYKGLFEFVQDYVYDDVGMLSAMLVLSEVSAFVRKKSNRYYGRMLNAYIDQWNMLYKKAREGITKIEPFLTSFYKGDVDVWIDSIPRDNVFLCYPPFYKGGYEKMFKMLEDIFIWTPPEYEMMDKEKVAVFCKKITEFERFFFCSDVLFPDFEKHLIGKIQETSRNVPVYVYSNYEEKSRIVMPNQSLQSPLFEKLDVDEDLGEKLEVVPLQIKEFNALRSMYLDPHIPPATPSASYAVLVDKKFIGAFALSSSPTLLNWGKYVEGPVIYLMTDFSIAPTKYKRLSKLVLYAILSDEVKFLVEKMRNRRVKQVVTTAFSKNPVSMKYRGVFTLITRTENEDESAPNKYKLNYFGNLGQWSLQEGLKLWKEKHSQTKEE